MSHFALSYPAALAVLLAVLLGSPCSGMAHRVNVFAYAEGDMIHVECGYNRSERVRSGEIEVRNAADGTVYLTGKTDEKGNFAFPVPLAARAAKADLRVVLRAGEGHQNDCLVKAGEYLEVAPTAETPAAVPVKASPASQAVSPASATPTAPAASTADAQMLRTIVEEAVEKKIAPLRAILLEEKQQGPGMTEIVGGIGYLVGIAGLLAYARSRKGSRT